jgi:hypothetical protein
VVDGKLAGCAFGENAQGLVWNQSLLDKHELPAPKKNTEAELGVMAYPGDPSAQWARASMYLSVFRGSKHGTPRWM